MSTYRYLTSMVSDLVKTLSDDTTINENHIYFLLDKYRTYLLKQKYEKDITRNIPQSNYQSVCVELEQVPMYAGCTNECLCGEYEENYLRSTTKIPTVMGLGNIRVTGNNIFRNAFTYVTPERLEFVGFNKWLNNVIYCTIAADGYLYIKGSNNDFLNLVSTGVRITALFDNPSDAYEYCCCEKDSGDTCTLPCDPFDYELPLEDALITQLMALVIKDVLGAAYRPKDSTNNANDDLADIAAFVRQNIKDKYVKDTQQ